MQLTIDVSEKDLIDFGTESVQNEINKAIRWMRIRQLFMKIYDKLKDIDEQTYYSELENIRESAWMEYKK
jgi:hypothetical protein